MDDEFFQCSSYLLVAVRLYIKKGAVSKLIY